MTFLNMSAEMRDLRKLLWLRHGCPRYTLYGDDGEMQCNNPSCMIDFKRDSIETIKQRWQSHGQKLIDDAGGMEAVLQAIADKTGQNE